MSKEYITKSTSRNTAKVSDIVIHETGNTRKILRPELIEINPKNPAAGVSASIIHQKKSKDGWVDITDTPLSKLKAGEMKTIHLDSQTTLNLFQELLKLYQLHSEAGVELGETKFVVGHANEMIRVDSQRAELVRKLVEQDHSEEVWTQLVETNPDLATRLSVVQLHQSRSKILEQFHQMLTQENKESTWQDFFEDNKWIFGYGLNYQILRQTINQPVYGGQKVTGSGAHRGDFLVATSAGSKFTVLVEIKTPQAFLVRQKYRNDTYLPGVDVVGGVTQLRANASLWENEGSRTSANRDLLEADGIHTLQPKKILVVGNTKQISNEKSKRDSFELFRRNQVDVEILTFDELYERAKFIVDHSDSADEPDQNLFE